MHRHETAVLKYIEVPMPNLMAACRNYFDRDLAIQVADERCIRDSSLPTNADSLATFLADLPTDSLRYDFLIQYVIALKDKIAAKASCGCYYSAEEGEPCEHDWAKVLKTDVIEPYPGKRCLTDAEIRRHANDELNDDEYMLAYNHVSDCSDCSARFEVAMDNHCIDQQFGPQHRSS